MCVTIFISHFQWFSHRRREFLERRILFNQLREESHNLQPEDWSKILSDWKAISEILREWSNRLESELPKPLMDLSQWLSSGEQLVHSSIDVSRDKARHSLWALDAMLENLKKHFKSLEFQRNKLERTLADTKTPTEILAPLEIRLESLAEEYKIRHETLLLIRAHYRILVLVEELGKKMDTWTNADSFSTIKMWYDEYLKEFSREPEARFHTLLAEMHDSIPKEPENVKIEAQKSYTDASDSSVNVVARFKDMRKYLEELLHLWEIFESESSKIDMTLHRFEREKLSADETIQELLRRLEAVAERLGRKSTPHARSSIDIRISNYRRRIEQLTRPIGRRLVVNIQPPVETSPLPSPSSNELAELAHISILQGTKFEQWLYSVSHLSKRRVKSAHECARIIEKLQVCDFYSEKKKVFYIKSKRKHICTKFAKRSSFWQEK